MEKFLLTIKFKQNKSAPETMITKIKDSTIGKEKSAAKNNKVMMILPRCI